MGADDVYPTEMPDHPPSPIPALDDDTTERLLSGRLDPDDAPPGYAGVARLLQTAAAPPHPDELAGQEAALALFRATWADPAKVGGHRSGRVRGRLVAVALAGVLVAGGAVAGGAATGGLWTTGGAPSSGGAEPGSVAGSGGSGLLRPSGPAVVTERERAVARHSGGGSSRGGGAAHGTKPVRAPVANGSKAKASKPGKPKAERPETERPEAEKPETQQPAPKGPKAQQPTPKGPKATPSQHAIRARGERR